MARPDGGTGLVPFGIGHNGGPPLDPGANWRHFCWKKRTRPVGSRLILYGDGLFGFIEAARSA